MRRSYGTGTLRIRTNKAGVESWYGQWYAGGERVARKLGEVRPRGTRLGLTKAQAEKELRRQMAETKPTATTGERLDIAELGRRYIQQLEKLNRKRTTITFVRMVLRVHLEPFFGERGIASIKPADVDDLVSKLEAEGLAPKSIHNYVGTLSALFNFARAPRRKWASDNPCEGTDLPGVPEDTEDIQFLEAHELEALVRAVPAGPYQAVDRAMYETAAMTGLRQGELIGLPWGDVDRKIAKIRVRRNYVRGEYDSPKSRRERGVPMAGRVGEVLDGLFQARHGYPRSEDNGAHAGDLVFPDPIKGGPLQRSQVLYRFKAALRAAYLDESLVFHDLRHTFGTRMAAAGVPMRTLQEWMGHAKIATTERYAHYAPNHHEAAMVDRAFAPRDTVHDTFSTQTHANGGHPTSMNTGGIDLQ
jgi:integrase